LNMRIIGCGNVLVGDDGFGIRVIEALREMLLPENVELIEGAVRGMELLDYFLNTDRVIIVDAVVLRGEPGEFYRLDLDDLLQMSRNCITNLHQIGIAEVLKVAMKLYPDELCRNILLIGVEVGRVENEFSMKLSSNLEKVLPDAIELILNEVKDKH